MKKVYTALLLILLAAMFSVGVYSLADYDATGSVSEKREFVKPEFSVKSLLDGTYIPALEQYYSDTFPGRESLLKANRTLNKFYYYSGSGEDSVLILNQNDSAAQGGEYDQEHQARDTQQAADTMGDGVHDLLAHCVVWNGRGLGSRLRTVARIGHAGYILQRKEFSTLYQSVWVRVKFAPYVTPCLPILCLLTHQRRTSIMRLH